MDGFVSRKVARLHPWAVAVGIAVVALVPGLGSAAAASAYERPLRVLFIGNSQTSTNDLPAFVAEIAKASRGRKVDYRTFAPSAVNLEDDWYLSSGAETVLNQRWDAVVIQQGPSVLAGARARLCAYAKLFADEARAAGARPYLLMVWPRRGSAVDPVVESYAAGASAAGATLLPAGIAWAALLRRAPNLPLYAWDGIHPSRLGTYLAAVVVYAGLRKISPVAPNSLVVSGNPFWIPRPTARVFRDAAAEALRTPAPVAACS